MLPIEDRFWSRVNKTDGCWQWVGKIDAYGYGGYTNREWPTNIAHRISWLLVRGELPDLTLDHLCLNKLCVNPDHLEPVTAAENHRRYREGRRMCRNGHELPGPGRCEICWRAGRARMEARRKAARADGTALLKVTDDMHGRYSTYTTYGCRCEPCRAAASAAGKRRRPRSKDVA